MSNDLYDRVSGHRSYATRVHTVIVEKVLGKALPGDAQVHHVDGNRKNSRNDNLVVCPDTAYHMLLHRRTAALNLSGRADWMKCTFCKGYDDPKNLTVTIRKVYGSPTSLAYHKSCNTNAGRKYWAKASPEKRKLYGHK